MARHRTERRRGKSRFRPQVFKISKHLGRQEAFERAKKKATRDFRGFSYNQKTGRAVLI